MVKSKQAIEEEAMEDYLKELGKKHAEEMKAVDWLEVFKDDVEDVLVEKIAEFEEEQEIKLKGIRDHQKKKFAEMQEIPEEKREWYWRFWCELYVEYFLQPPITLLSRRITRLTHDLYTVRRKKGTIAYDSKEEEWDDQKERAKERSIEDVISPYLENPRRHGNIINAFCPFHEERTPSFVIYLNTNQYHCFGGCGAHGDVIDFYMKFKKVDFSTAIRELA